MGSSNNPPLPGKDITPSQEPRAAEPPFNAAVRGEGAAKPEVLHYDLKLSTPVFAPDGTTVRQGEAEAKRQAGVGDRMTRLMSELEKDSEKARDPVQLGRDFDDAHDHRR